MKLDTVYMIVNLKVPGIVYATPAMKPDEAWNNAIRGTINSKSALMRSGWRARRVDICLAPKEPK